MASQVSYRVVKATNGAAVAVLGVNNPPVNSLGIGVRNGLVEGFNRAIADENVKVLIIIGEGRTFPAGADIKEFHSKTAAINPLNKIVDILELSSKPIIAAIHGTALGGGLEIALACHYRLALSSAAVGLPEVALGILPGAGGTQRLPRLSGLEKALEIIVSGQQVKASKALSLGILDKIIEDNEKSPQERLLEASLDFISSSSIDALSPSSLDSRRTRNRSSIPEGFDKETALSMLEGAKEMVAKRSRGYLAPLAIVDAIKAAVENDKTYDAGAQVEIQLIYKLMQGTQAKGLQHLFFAERETSKIPGITAAPATVNAAVVIGSGTMGTGIAICLIEANIPTSIFDVDRKSLLRAQETVKKTLFSKVEKGRLTKEMAEKKFGLLNLLGLSIEDNVKLEEEENKVLSKADMIIEAVFESMELKKKVFNRLDKYCKKEAILASNTSTLSIDEICTATSRPQQVIGMHFFSPANIMRLLEVVRGRNTSSETISTAMALGKRIKKICVLVGNCEGFVGNRMLEGYAREAGFMLEEGSLPHQVDKVLNKFGMAMGPFQMGDLAGNDVGWRIRQGKGLTDPKTRAAVNFKERYSELADKLCEAGRLGQKTSAGWYKYEKGNRRGIIDPEVETLIIDYSKSKGIERREIKEEEIFERCLFPLVNEGFKILEEGIALRPSDIDVIWIYGYGWPAFRGGPMFWAAQELDGGLERVLDGLRKWHQKFPSSKHFEPAKLLERIVAEEKLKKKKEKTTTQSKL